MLNKKGVFLFVMTLTLMFVFMSYYSSQIVESLVPVNQGEKHLVVDGEQNGIKYQIFKSNSQDHFVIRFYKDQGNVVSTKITDLTVELEIEEGKLLSVAPAGKIEDNSSQYTYSSRRGLNEQLEDKGIFLIFKLAGDENTHGSLTFSVTESNGISKTKVTKDSNVIKFTTK